MDPKRKKSRDQSIPDQQSVSQIDVEEYQEDPYLRATDNLMVAKESQMYSINYEVPDASQRSESASITHESN